jgi:hypothetical protein
MQSLLIVLLAITQNLDYLTHLVLGVNMIIMAVVILRSRLVTSSKNQEPGN